MNLHKKLFRRNEKLGSIIIIINEMGNQAG